MRRNTQSSKFKVGEFRAPFAFTLIELLVVISIIGILAGLLVYLLPAVTEKRVRSRVTVELNTVETIINSYKEKRGFYPPDNPVQVDRPPLYYELTAAEVPASLYAQATSMGMNTNILNAISAGSTDARNFYPTLRQSQITEINGVRFIGVKATAADGSDFTTWRYDSSSTNRHNHESFDLWADVKIGNKVITIGNWKD